MLQAVIPLTEVETLVTEAGPSVQERRVPRTRATERVRRRITRARAERSEQPEVGLNNNIEQPSFYQIEVGLHTSNYLCVELKSTPQSGVINE